MHWVASEQMSPFVSGQQSAISTMEVCKMIVLQSPYAVATKHWMKSTKMQSRGDLSSHGCIYFCRVVIEQIEGNTQNVLGQRCPCQPWKLLFVFTDQWEFIIKTTLKLYLKTAPLTAFVCNINCVLFKSLPRISWTILCEHFAIKSFVMVGTNIR